MRPPHEAVHLTWYGTFVFITGRRQKVMDEAVTLS
jgi:hypothetical protein